MSEDKAKAARARNTREAEQCLRQFLTDGPKGNSNEFQRSWCRTFGRKTGEHSGEVAEYRPAHHDEPNPGFVAKCLVCMKFAADGLLTPEGKPARCDDPTCWCHSKEET